MRKHHSHSSLLLSSAPCDASPYEYCTFTGTHLTPTSTTTFNSCNFTGLSSEYNGGAIYFISGASLTIEQCTFNQCSTRSEEFSDQYGGGAIDINCGTISVFSTVFISCSTASYAGGMLIEQDCTPSIVSLCTFLSCTARFGGGLMTFWGPTSFVLSSRFISCTGFIAGGGMYYNGWESDWLNITDTLFTLNIADIMRDGIETRGGGAFENHRSNAYDSHFSFLFFTGNVAKKTYGHDIATQIYRLSSDCISHSFTTATSNSFWNVDGHMNNWLPKGICTYNI